MHGPIIISWESPGLVYSFSFPLKLRKLKLQHKLQICLQYIIIPDPIYIACLRLVNSLNSVSKNANKIAVVPL